MQKILIIGSNGAGKTTFSYILAEKTGLPLTHIDRLYWRGRWKVTPREEFERTVLEKAHEDAWIIEGNNLRSLPARLALADTVLWFEFPPFVCACNVLRRELRWRGKARPDMPDACISKFSPSFLRQVLGFNRQNRARIEQMLAAAPHARIVKFASYRQVKSFLNTL